MGHRGPRRGRTGISRSGSGRGRGRAGILRLHGFALRRSGAGRYIGSIAGSCLRSCVKCRLRLKAVSGVCVASALALSPGALMQPVSPQAKAAISIASIMLSSFFPCFILFSFLLFSFCRARPLPETEPRMGGRCVFDAFFAHFYCVLTRFFAVF